MRITPGQKDLLISRWAHDTHPSWDVCSAAPLIIPALGVPRCSSPSANGPYSNENCLTQDSAPSLGGGGSRSLAALRYPEVQPCCSVQGNSGGPFLLQNSSWGWLKLLLRIRNWTSPSALSCCLYFLSSAVPKCTPYKPNACESSSRSLFQGSQTQTLDFYGPSRKTIRQLATTTKAYRTEVSLSCSLVSSLEW